MSLIERYIAQPGRFLLMAGDRMIGNFATRESAVGFADSLCVPCRVYDDTGSVVYSVESIP